MGPLGCGGALGGGGGPVPRPAMVPSQPHGDWAIHVARPFPSEGNLGAATQGRTLSQSRLCACSGSRFETISCNDAMDAGAGPTVWASFWAIYLEPLRPTTAVTALSPPEPSKEFNRSDDPMIADVGASAAVRPYFFLLLVTKVHDSDKMK